MTKRKTLIITTLFLLVLTGIRLLWISFQAPPNHPHAVQGIMDLRDWDFESNRPITLDGEWEFYPLRLIANEGSNPENNSQPAYIQVPGSWEASLTSDSSSMLGYGSYRLRILVDSADQERSYGFRVTGITNSSELFVNGRLVGHAGKPSSNPAEYTPKSLPYTESYTTNSQILDVVIHVSNYSNPVKGGIFRSIKFGDGNAIQNEKWFSISAQVLVGFLLFLHAVYACILYFIGTTKKILISFIMLIFSAIIMTLTDDDRLLLTWFPINYSWGIKLQYISLILVGLFLLRFVLQLLPEYTKVITFKYFLVLAGLTIIVILIAPVSFNIQAGVFYLPILLIPGKIIPTIILRSASRGDKDIVFLLLGTTTLLSNAIWGVIKNRFWTDLNYYPIDLIVTFLVLAAFWFKRFFRASMQSQKLAEKLQKADKLKDDFLANTSHELRNPLHGMINFAQSVLDTGADKLDADNTNKLETLVSVGKRMSLLLTDLLELNRLKESGMVLHPAPTAIQPLVLGVFDMVRYLVKDKPVNLVNAVPDKFPPIMADENRLLQIMFNLVHNAVKFTHAGHITIDCVYKNGKAEISVTDSGIGMDKETLDRIFQRYEQGDSSMTAIAGGIGLGLSISKQLVELHGGALRVSSVIGQGTTFTFDLTIAEPYSESGINEHPTLLIAAAVEEIEIGELAEQFADQPDVMIGDKRSSILAVDDDSVNLSILTNILPRDSYDVVTVSSAETALALIDKRDWDLVISDVMMPRMSGYELTQAIRERFSVSELPILLLTARSRSEDIEAGFRAGANDYVTKPVDSLALRSRVQALTGLKQSVRERLRLEAAWLQAQIQPHFLFNTLTALAALSEIDTSRMRSLLEAFGNYLRSSFDFQNTEQLVTLNHELDLVRSYLYIEKERFEERLQVTWEVNEASLLRIPPLTIQPLVENAVRHGLMKRAQGGAIHIKVVEDDEYAEVSISDNGVGIEEDKLKSIFDIPAGNPDNGIGLLNTDRRLKQLYGQGLQIRSSADRGTTVSFKVFKTSQ
ncbi:ATP-binding protein [Cohnella herbarum]|uniref:Circadian input-output histidine kinase CikA n=1 Tax=Cohnella herbarum TaxID=2728023 RepID=A0A7Z2VG81_9BACL|nr:ATP-binding protein [Cohnella herbarum]QJD82360.1 response regulator [Cohnella herbarum]